MNPEDFDPAVFKVKKPTCKECKNGELDFALFDNYNNSGISYVQWYCKQRCGFFLNVEILWILIHEEKREYQENDQADHD